MKRSYNKLYSWLILIGLSVQSFTPIVAAAHSRSVVPKSTQTKTGAPGQSIVVHSEIINLKVS